jgi:hypothetical protein
VPGLCDTEQPALRLVAGDAHLAACHYSEDLADVTVESLRETVDVESEVELLDAELGPTTVDEGAIVPHDVIVEEGVAHPGVIEGTLDERPGPTIWPQTAPNGEDEAR